ncbi:MAG: secretin N-terminal domain-containing protein [Rhodoferax sp.]
MLDTNLISAGTPCGPLGKSAPLLAALACSLLAGCANIDHTRGLINMKVGQPDQGVQQLGKAAQRAPTDAGYKIDYLSHREQQVQEMLRQSEDQRADGQLAAARETLQRALVIDPGNTRVPIALNTLAQEVRNEKLLTEGERLLDQGKLDQALEKASRVLEDFPRNRRAISLRDSVLDAKAELDIARARDLAARTILEAPVTLQYSEASLKLVFESISKSTQINILLDKKVKQEAKVTIYVKDISVSDAIDLILMQNQLRKRVINGNTIIIYPASTSKQAEYEELLIRTYQITNADIKYIANMLKSMLKIKELSADEKTGLLVLRDSVEILRMAERLIAAHDVPDPEIMLEVEVLEVSNARDSNLGIKPPNSVTLSTPGGSKSITLGELRGLTSNDLLVSSLSTTINFKLEDAEAKILASPRVRSRNREIAKIMIGDRVPTITNTVTPVNTGSSVVTSNVSYQDVGLKLEFEPQVYANNEVGIKVSLEVSNIAREFTDANGGRSYQIGTRNAASNLRLKDGETQILGGLITDDDRNTASKIPGFGHLPIIGRLFGNNAGTATQSEILLAITPRILRNLAVRTSDVKSIYSGTYNSLREKPILAEPISQLRVSGTFNPNADASAAPSTAGSTGSTNGANASGILINPKPAQTAFPTSNTGQPMKPNSGSTVLGTRSTPALSPPPPIFLRPPTPASQ